MVFILLKKEQKREQLIKENIISLNKLQDEVIAVYPAISISGATKECDTIINEKNNQDVVFWVHDALLNLVREES